jgi:hypothetical protein
VQQDDINLSFFKKSQECESNILQKSIFIYVSQLCVIRFCPRASTVKQDSAHYTNRPVSHFLPYCYAFKLCVLSLWLACGAWNKSVSSLTRWETPSLHSCTKTATVKVMLHLPYTTRTRKNALYKPDTNHHKYANITHRTTTVSFPSARAGGRLRNLRYMTGKPTCDQRYLSVEIAIRYFVPHRHQ